MRPKYEQIEYSSDLYLESDEKVLLKLEGRDIWSEYIYRRTDSYLSKIGYRYSKIAVCPSINIYGQTAILVR